MTPMTQTNNAIHLVRVRNVSGSCLSSLRPGDGKRWAENRFAMKLKDAEATHDR